MNPNDEDVNADVKATEPVTREAVETPAEGVEAEVVNVEGEEKGGVEDDTEE